jgi:hypothetical protein
VRFVHGVSKEPELVRDFAARHGFRLSTDLSDALADPQVQAVWLATPHSLHVEQVRAVAASSRAVWCEKPLALTRAEAGAQVSCDAQTLRQHTADLKRVNETLWEIEDAIRECEARGDFGERFVALARAVYRHNDARARLKKAISLASGSRLIEEKAYAAYAPRREPG